MNGIYFALSIVGVFFIVHWYIKNDGRERTSGLLAMVSPPEDEQHDNEA